MNDIWLKIYFLINFKSVREDSVISAFGELLKSLNQNSSLEECIKNYSQFVDVLDNRDFSLYLKSILPPVSKNSKTEYELKILNELSKIGYSDIKNLLIEKFKDYKALLDNLPSFLNSGLDLTLDDIIDAPECRTFIFEDLKLKPANMTEPLSFKDLKGYEEQKKVLLINTKALLEGSKVNNILLYGDAGCGKSTSVRALLNEFKRIRIVQIFKSDLINLDKLYEILRALPHKFIIFADDISFDETDRELSTMKAVLEGSLIQCPKNAAIYATSNRRHLIRESFHSRMGDEVHLNDTLNEITSLSERFGINLFFAKPTNDEFIDIVLKLAQDYSLDIDKEVLLQKAQKLAIMKGSKSPRIARQLVDSLKIEMNI